MKDPKDWQRDEVYAWEWKWRSWGTRTHSSKDIRTWIEWATRRYGLKPPKVTIHSSKKDRTSWFSCKLMQISLATKTGVNIPVALHEASHYIAYAHFKDMSHGKKWLGIYLHLLESARVAPRSALLASVNEEGLAYVKNFTPAKVQKRKKARGR